MRNSIQSLVLSLIHTFRKSQSQKNPLSSNSVEPLRVGARAAYGLPSKTRNSFHFPFPSPFQRPLPLMSLWTLSLIFVSLIVIPDLNRKLMSIPVVAPSSMLTSEERGLTSATPSLGGRKMKAASEGVGSRDNGEGTKKGQLRDNEGADGKQGTDFGEKGKGVASVERGEGVASVKSLGSEEEVLWFDPATDGSTENMQAQNSASDATVDNTGGVEEDQDGGGRSRGGSFQVASNVNHRKLRESAGEKQASDVVWPTKLVLAMATGYGVDNVSIIVRTFRQHVKGARLVLFVDQPIRGWIPRKGVIIQPFHKPESGPWSDMPGWLIRFKIFGLFLQTIMERNQDGKQSTVIFSDSRDVAFLGDPFPLFKNSSSAYLFQESTAFPDQSAKKLSTNHKWLSACYGSRNAFSLAGKKVINAGFMAGSFHAMIRLAGAITTEAERLPKDSCVSKWGADQAIVNHLVRSGALRLIVPVILENNEHGAVMQRFSKKAIVHIANQDEDESMPLLRNKEGKEILVIHGYDRFSDTDDVVTQML